MPHYDVIHRNAQPRNEKIFSWTRRLTESIESTDCGIEGLNSSLAQSAGGLWCCKAQQKSGPWVFRDWKVFSTCRVHKNKNLVLRRTQWSMAYDYEYGFDIVDNAAMQWNWSNHQSIPGPLFRGRIEGCVNNKKDICEWWRTFHYSEKA